MTTETSFITSAVAYVATYNRDTKSVVVTGPGYSDEGRRMAYSFPNPLTERQMLAFGLGLKILHFLETGDANKDQQELLQAAMKLNKESM